MSCIIAILGPVPWYKKAIYWICGIESLANKKSQVPITPEQDKSIDEDPLHATIVNTIAIALMVGTAFMWGFYA